MLIMVLADVLRPVALKFMQLLETTDQKPGGAAIYLHSCAEAGITRSRCLQKLKEISVYEINQTEMCNEVSA
jgi:hypothetical protein